MIIDGHTHISKEEVEQGILSVFEEFEIYSFACGTHPESCAFVRELAEKSPFVLPTFGLHPWYAGEFQVSDLREYLKDCKILGEIGLDTLWCDVPIERQEEAFFLQLDMAEERGIPVILHTKGAEERIAEILESYTMPVLVHWYSHGQHLEKFIARDCYFTVGPDFATNEAVQQVVSQVSMDRLLVETDGVSALSWAFSKECTIADIPKALKNSMQYISRVKNISEEQVRICLENNFNRLTFTA